MPLSLTDHTSPSDTSSIRLVRYDLNGQNGHGFNLVSSSKCQPKIPEPVDHPVCHVPEYRMSLPSLPVAPSLTCHFQGTPPPRPPSSSSRCPIELPRRAS